jgi:hypothetical protein
VVVVVVVVVIFYFNIAFIVLQNDLKAGCNE